MTYDEQLQSDEWKLKRDLILERDGFKCQHCNKKRTPLFGISSSFGIKNLEEIKENGYSVGTKLIDSKLLYFKNGMLLSIDYIDDENDFLEDNLKFALKVSVNKNDSSKKDYSIFCFISDYDQIDLNIHHTYYIVGKMAWEYENEALITLCYSCHQEVHELNKIPIYNSKRELIDHAKICSKCNGSGVLLEYRYWQNGVCFGCSGNGVTM